MGYYFIYSFLAFLYSAIGCTECRLCNSLALAIGASIILWHFCIILLVTWNADNVTLSLAIVHARSCISSCLMLHISIIMLQINSWVLGDESTQLLPLRLFLLNYVN